MSDFLEVLILLIFGVISVGMAIAMLAMAYCTTLEALEARRKARAARCRRHLAELEKETK